MTGMMHVDAAKARADLLDALGRAPALLSAFVQTIPEEKLDLRRGEGFWTVAEHGSHLAQVQPMLLGRMERFLAEEHPEFVPYIPGSGEQEPATPPRMEMAQAMTEFAACREKQVALLKTADGAVWHRTAVHPEYELYSLHILVRHVLMHDFWHMYRMEELWLTRDDYLTA
jgi:uncharacterized damage-inducible protein DinB